NIPAGSHHGPIERPVRGRRLEGDCNSAAQRELLPFHARGSTLCLTEGSPLRMPSLNSATPTRLEVQSAPVWKKLLTAARLGPNRLKTRAAMSMTSFGATQRSFSIVSERGDSRFPTSRADIAW